MKTYILSTDKKKDGFLLLILSVTFTVFHFIIANFPKTLETYADELRYYELARSFFAGKGISYRGIPFEYQKIAYPLAILPAFFFKSGMARNSVISLLNSIMMTLSVIPLYSIGKTLKLKRFFLYIIVIQLFSWPDMFFSMTFMSENLYWFLFFAFMSIWLKSLDTEGIRYTIIASFLCYLCYLCKETAAVIIPAYIVFEFVQSLFLFKSSYSFKSSISKDRYLKLLVFIVTFLAVFILAKLTVFHGLKNSYSNGIWPPLTKQTFSYFVYGFAVFLAAILAASFFFPLVYPVVFYHKLSEKAKRLFLFTILFLLGSALVIAYTITTREDFGRIAPRIHLRYVAPTFVLLFAVLYSLPQGRNILFSKSSRLVLGTAVLFALIFKGLISGSAVDHFSLVWYEYWQLKLGEHLYIPVINSLLVFLWIFGHFCFCKSEKAGFFFLLLFSISLNTLDSFFVAKRLYEAYKLPNSLFLAQKSLDKLQKTKKNVLFVGSCYSKASKFFEIYFEGNDRIYFSDESDFVELIEETPINELTLYESVFHNSYKSISEISYIIVPTESLLIPINAYLDSDLSNSYFYVYEQKDSLTLGFEKNKQWFYPFNGQNISGGFDKDSVRYLNPDGYSFGPYIPLDSGDYIATIKGKNLSSHFIDVYSQLGDVHHDFEEDGNDDTLLIHFILNAPVKNIEIFIRNDGNDIMEMESFVIKKDRR